jgi:ribose transport system ATP-binding protein
VNTSAQTCVRPVATAAGRADRGDRGAAAAARSAHLLEVERLSKRFGAIPALRNVSLTVDSGTVHGLCGANGAGKSTLVRVLAGLEVPDHGQLRIDGWPVRIRNPQDASKLGLRFIHQELQLVPKFTALENLALVYPAARRGGLVNRGAVRRRARQVLAELEAEIPLDAPAERLSVAARWMVSLARALMSDARIVAMDEPTVAFTDAEAEHLFAVVARLAAQGTGVLYISHRLQEVLRIADRISVLREGRLVSSRPASGYDRESLTHEIVGGEVEAAIRQAHAPRRAAPVALTASGLVREPRVQGIDLEVHAGEVLGLAGLVGSGRTELARLLFGVDRPTAGTMTLEGRPYRPRSAFDAIRHGVAMVPEERRAEALLLTEPVWFNVALTPAGDAAPRRGWLSPRRARAAAQRLIGEFGIAAASTRQPVVELSGGNQQKLVVGRAVEAGPRLLILDEPTAGVDAGARAEIYRIIDALAAAGTAVLMIASDFEELSICHRVAVIREGRIGAVIDGADASKELLTSLCYATHSEEEA